MAAGFPLLLPGQYGRVSVKHPADLGAERRPFDRFAEAASNFTSNPPFFVFCFALGLAWMAAYALGGSDSLKHFLEGSMAFVALIVIAVLKNSEKRAEHAMHEKLDALTAAMLDERGKEPADEDADRQLEHAHRLHDEV